MNAQEKIAVIQAQEDGRSLQLRVKRGEERHAGNLFEQFGHNWFDSCHGRSFQRLGKHHFNFATYDYRIKPSYPTIKLTSEYSAVVEEEIVRVGCQSIPHSKVLEVAEAIKGKSWTDSSIKLPKEWDHVMVKMIDGSVKEVFLSIERPRFWNTAPFGGKDEYVSVNGTSWREKECSITSTSRV